MTAAMGLALTTAGTAGQVGGDPRPLAKIPETHGKLKPSHGYWVECDNVGENCHYVFMFGQVGSDGQPAPGAKYHRIAAKKTVKLDHGYWVECDNVGENCHYVFMFGKTDEPKT
jgi:hypothetical protein